jgi:hypothetical protein
MAVLTVLDAKRATDGTDLAGAAAAGGGDSFANDGMTVLVIKNGGGSPITLTAVTTITIDGLAVTDLTCSIGAGATRAVGPFPTSYYSSTVSLTYSGVTSVTVQPLRVTPTG